MNKKKSLAKIFLIIIVLSLLFVKEISIFKTQKDKLRYGFTLEEIGERIQYIYKYENTLKIQTLSQFGELGKLPQGKCGGQVILYPGRPCEHYIKKERWRSLSCIC